MCQNVQKFSNNGVVNIATANPNLNGTGALGIVVTAGNNGTVIQSIMVQGTGSTAQGMIRLFISNGTTSYLFQEVMVPANIQTGVVPAFAILLDTPIVLKAGYSLLASTQNAESYNVIGSAENWANCACPS